MFEGAPRPFFSRRAIFLTVSTLFVVAAIVVAHEVLLPVILGIVIAYVLMPLVELVEAKRASRAVSILIVYTVVLGSLFLFVRLTAPRIGQEVQGFVRELPKISATASREWVPAFQSRLRALTGREAPVEVPPSNEPSVVVKKRADDTYAIELGSGFIIRPDQDGYVVDRADDKKTPLDPDQLIARSIEGGVSYARHNAFELVKLTGGIVRGVSRFFFVFGLTLMIAAYLMMTKEKIFAFFRTLIRPSARYDFERLIMRMDKGLSGVIRGQLMICLVNGALSAVGFAILGLKYWPILAILATVLSLVPIFGVIASSIPVVAIGLTQSWQTGALVFLWILAIHQLEANFFNPKIMGDAAKIHPVLVVASLLAGEHLFGAVGALLAVPCMSLTQSLFLHFREVAHRTDPELSLEVLPSSLPPPPPSKSIPAG